MSNRTSLTLGFDRQPKNGQIVIMLYAFQDILAKYLNSHLPVIVETTIRQSGKLDIPSHSKYHCSEVYINIKTWLVIETEPLSW